MAQIDKTLYRAPGKITNRAAWAVSSDGLMDLPVSVPRELSGTYGRGANPYPTLSRDVAETTANSGDPHGL
jgi:hypothetical protein